MIHNQVKVIEPSEFQPPKERKLRVAAYARVSADMECTQSSLDAQISYYSGYIQEHENWEFAGIYADNGISGTSVRREKFQGMMEECKSGNIDLILTKSISRFARNTVNLLETVRYLKSIGVEVRFQRENISTFSGEGELLLTILASFAQEESRSISENIKWSIRKGFEQGKTNSHKLYGYYWGESHFEIQQEEAEIVKYIFRHYLKGDSVERLQMKLDELDAHASKGGRFSSTTIRSILRQEKYTGNMILQKTYVENHITHKKRVNRGEVPQYYVENTHPAIVSKAEFDQVQLELRRRKELGIHNISSVQLNCFSGKIKCGGCGSIYRRHRKERMDHSWYVVWVCLGKDRKGMKFCNSVRIPEELLENACMMALDVREFDERKFLDKVDKIIVIGGYWMHFYWKDGTIKKIKWDSKLDRELRRKKRYQFQGERMRNNHYARRKYPLDTEEKR